MRVKGTVLWFDVTKGFGFIRPDDGSKDARISFEAIRTPGFKTLREGQRVEYEPRLTAKGISAECLDYEE